jgi:hypothetical protein
METETIDDPELNSKYENLFSIEPTESSEVVVQTSGNVITFSTGGVKNEHINEFLNKQGVTISDSMLLRKVIIDDNQLTFLFENTAGNQKSFKVVTHDINTLLSEAFKDYSVKEGINYQNLKSLRKISNFNFNGSTINLVKVNGKYHQLEQNGNLYNFKLIGKTKVGDTYIIYLESSIFGPGIVRIETNNFPIEYTGSAFLGYQPYDIANGNILYYINDSNEIIRNENGKETVCSLTSITDDEIILSDEQGLIRLKRSLSAPEQMFRLESILEQSPFESTFKIRKFKNKDKDE